MLKAGDKVMLITTHPFYHDINKGTILEVFQHPGILSEEGLYLDLQKISSRGIALYRAWNKGAGLNFIEGIHYKRMSTKSHLPKWW